MFLCGFYDGKNLINGRNLEPVSKQTDEMKFIVWNGYGGEKEIVIPFIHVGGDVRYYFAFQPGAPIPKI